MLRQIYGQLFFLTACGNNTSGQLGLGLSGAASFGTYQVSCSIRYFRTCLTFSLKSPTPVPLPLSHETPHFIPPLPAQTQSQTLRAAFLRKNTTTAQNTQNTQNTREHRENAPFFNPRKGRSERNKEARKGGGIEQRSWN